MLSSVQHDLQRQGMRAAWVPEANLHLSLVFLGNLPETLQDAIELSMQTAAAGIPPFSFTIGNLGSFGPPRSPRVIWAGIQTEKILYELQSRLNSNLRSLDFDTEDRPYHPHITLARIKPQHRKDKSTDYAKIISNSNSPEPYRVNAASIDLMQSTLTPQGSSYNLLFSQPLENTA